MSLFSLIVYLGLTLAEDGATINNEDRKESDTRKNLPYFVTFKELQQKSAFLKIKAQAFEAGDFLSIFLRFWGF